MESLDFTSKIMPECYIFTTETYDPEDPNIKKFNLGSLDSPLNDGEKVEEFLMKSCGIEKERIYRKENCRANHYHWLLGIYFYMNFLIFFYNFQFIYFYIELIFLRPMDELSKNVKEIRDAPILFFLFFRPWNDKKWRNDRNR